MPITNVKLGSMALGLNNRLPPTQLGRTMPDRSSATFLSAAMNVDLTARGYLRRRRGRKLERAGAGTHSVWGDGDEGYCAAGGNLLHLAAVNDSLQATTVLSGLSDLEPISYTRLADGDVAWSNSYRIGRLRGAVAWPLATPRPAVVPSVVLTSGGLPAGRYQVAFTAFGPLGESASTTPVQIDVPANGGLSIFGLTNAMRVYMTGPNGAVFNQASHSAGDIVSLTNTGAELRSLLLDDLPPGQIVRQYKGSILVASGSSLLIGEPYSSLLNPSKGYIPFPKPITVVEPCEAGVFVCADKTYWLGGSLLDGQPARVLDYGGLQGSGGHMLSTENQQIRQVFWLSPRGLVIGTPDGSATNVQEKALKFGGATAGATLFREQDGANHILAARMDPARPLSASMGFKRVDNIVKGTDI